MFFSDILSPFLLEATPPPINNGLSVGEICTICIAFLALGFSFWQGYEQRKHNRLSVKPILVIYPDIGGDKGSSLEIQNHGFGPAIITNVEVEYLDIDKKDSNCEGLPSFLVREGYGDFKSRWELLCPESSIIPAGVSKPIIGVLKLPDGLDESIHQQLAFQFHLTTRKIRITINYRSIYEKPQPPCCWHPVKKISKTSA